MSVSVKSYRDLLAWQKAMSLVETVYVVTQGFPSDERFGLTNQLRRATVSIPSNIAEGQGRGTTNEYIHFLRISRGSLQEVETQVLIAQRLCYLNDRDTEDVLRIADEVSRLLSGLIRSLQ